jgi:hypothetical protein
MAWRGGHLRAGSWALGVAAGLGRVFPGLRGPAPIDSPQMAAKPRRLAAIRVRLVRCTAIMAVRHGVAWRASACWQLGALGMAAGLGRVFPGLRGPALSRFATDGLYAP